MKRTTKTQMQPKLQLATLTVRILSPAQLDAARGGVIKRCTYEQSNCG